MRFRVSLILFGNVVRFFYFGNFLHRPSPMDSASTGRPPHASAAATTATATTAPAAKPAAIDILSERGMDHAAIDPLVGASQTAAPVIIIGSTPKHTKVNVAATFGPKMFPVSAYLINVSPVVPSGPNQGKDVKCGLGRGDGNKECFQYTHNNTKTMIRNLYSYADHEQQSSMGGRRSSSSSTPHVMVCGRGQAVETRGPPHVQGGAAHVEPTSHGPRPGLIHDNFQIGPVRPGPEHRSMTSPGKVKDRSCTRIYTQTVLVFLSIQLWHVQSLKLFKKPPHRLKSQPLEQQQIPCVRSSPFR